MNNEPNRPGVIAMIAFEPENEDAEPSHRASIKSTVSYEQTHGIDLPKQSPLFTVHLALQLLASSIGPIILRVELHPSKREASHL